MNTETCSIWFYKYCLIVELLQVGKKKLSGSYARENELSAGISLKYAKIFYEFVSKLRARFHPRLFVFMKRSFAYFKEISTSAR